jgi:hypothetical protein
MDVTGANGRAGLQPWSYDFRSTNQRGMRRFAYADVLHKSVIGWDLTVLPDPEPGGELAVGQARDKAPEHGEASSCFGSPTNRTTVMVTADPKVDTRPHRLGAVGLLSAAGAVPITSK